MVKIIDLEEELLSEEEAEKTDEDTNEEEDDEQPPDPLEPPHSTHSPDASLTLDASTSIELAATQSSPSASGDIQGRIHRPVEILPSLRVVSAALLWNVIARYSDQIKHSNGDQKLECRITPVNINNSQTSELQSETGERRNTQLASYVCRITGDFIEKKGDQIESDESIEEKSDGVCEKEQLAAKAAEIKTDLLPSPDLSAYVSNVPDSHAPRSYDTLQTAENEESDKNRIVEYTTTSFTECEQSTVKNSTVEDMNVDVMDSTDGKGVKKEPKEDEAACLPAHSIAKDCWEQWVSDDRLFNLTDDIHNAPSTSSAEILKPSQASETNERNRSKLENRHHSLRKRDLSVMFLERFIFVPTEKIGRILGKGGRRVKEIERKSGARIKIEHHRSNKPVTKLSLTGTDEQICKADEEICVIIRNYKPAKSGEPATASVSSQEEMELKRLLIGIKNQVLDAEKRCRIP